MSDEARSQPIDIIVTHQQTGGAGAQLIESDDDSAEFVQAQSELPLTGASSGHQSSADDVASRRDPQYTELLARGCDLLDGHGNVLGGEIHASYRRRRRLPLSPHSPDSTAFHEQLGDENNVLVPPVVPLPDALLDDELTVEMEDDINVCFPAFDSAKEHAGHMFRRDSAQSMLHSVYCIVVFAAILLLVQDDQRYGSWADKFWAYSTRVTHFNELPDWLKDNEFLHGGHRVPVPHMGACLRSVFALHTETGNIWTHLLGCVAFMGVAVWFLSRPEHHVQWQEKIVFSSFFLGAIMCLAMSTAFHTVCNHSHEVGKLFSKLDYVGISLMIVGSFIPWLFYGFYCRTEPKIVYSVLISVLVPVPDTGAFSIVVSLWDRFATPQFRPLRAGVFIGTGLSGVVPCIHYIITDGLVSLVRDVAFHWMALMAALYIGGALLYAWRVPERFFPGKCDIWFQSHQIFHMCVLVAAFVHYHGITEMAYNRLAAGSCEEQLERLVA